MVGSASASPAISGDAESKAKLLIERLCDEPSHHSTEKTGRPVRFELTNQTGLADRRVLENDRTQVSQVLGLVDRLANAGS
jgi:hypothetical protein